MKTMTGQELQAAIKSQQVTREHIALKCPRCGTVQSPRDFIRAGAGKDFAGVAPFFGTSCIGRFTGAPAARQVADGKACNWTLGGFLQLHEFEVLEDGERIPMFEPATPEEAHALKALADVLDAAQPRLPAGYGLADFFREAAELNLTALDLVPHLAQRPEFADCVPGTAKGA